MVREVFLLKKAETSGWAYFHEAHYPAKKWGSIHDALPFFDTYDAAKAMLSKRNDFDELIMPDGIYQIERAYIVEDV